MAAFGLVVGRLANVVQQSATPGEGAVQPDFLGHHAGNEGHLDAVPQHVLAVAGAEVQPAQQLYQPLVQVWMASSWQASWPNCMDVLFQFFLRGRHDLLDPRGVNAAVGNELVQREPGDLAADHVEAADDDHARRVVDNQVHARGLLEGADVASLAADDAALHLVVGDADRAGGRFGGVGGRVALQRGDDDLAGLLLADFGQLLIVAEDGGAGLLLELAVEKFQQPPRRLGLVQTAELVQRLPLHVDKLGKVFLAMVDLLYPLGELALRGLDNLLLLAEPARPAPPGHPAVCPAGVRAREARRESCGAPFRFPLAA